MARGPIYTLGSSNRSAEEFLELLRYYGIQALVDVRRFPTSHYPHFRREELADLVKGAGLEYHYLGQELGGYRSGGYENYTTTPDFGLGLERLEALAAERRVAVMCAERLPWRCHRRFIGLALKGRGWGIKHIIDVGRLWVPRPEATPAEG